MKKKNKFYTIWLLILSVLESQRTTCHHNLSLERFFVRHKIHDGQLLARTLAVMIAVSKHITDRALAAGNTTGVSHYCKAPPRC